MFQGDIDPEIAALLGADTAPKSFPGASPAVKPQYDALFEDESVSSVEVPEVNIASAAFPKISNNFETAGHKYFDDPDYYKKCLSGEGDPAQRLHGIVQKYINTTDAKDKTVYRQQLITAYWDFLSGIAKKATAKLPEPKRFLLRFGLLHPTMVPAEDRALLSRIVVDNNLNQPIYYLDEWFKAIGTGAIKPSMTDEVRVAKTNEQARMQQLLEKAIGKRDGARNLLKAKSDERSNYEAVLMEKVRYIVDHAPMPGLPDVAQAYNDTQRRAFNEIQDLLKRMYSADKDLSRFVEDLNQAITDVDTLEGKVSETGGSQPVNLQAVETEFETIKQMAKLTIGRQGNHFPFLTKEYFRSGQNDIGIRENVCNQLAFIESIDSEAFCRSYKNKLNRIIPFVVLIPAFGDTGICWEPFDRFNRATSRGRIAIPMYPKNLPMAILSAVADLRWQVAKEKASYYWMEEGLTGNYYQYFISKKLKGDVKEFFIQDYVTWITKESEAVQKLEKEVRGIFWRFIPFAQPVKEKLKGRSYIYQELYQRDVNRSMSDGY
jgi:hypothetical protein